MFSRRTIFVLSAALCLPGLLPVAYAEEQPKAAARNVVEFLQQREEQQLRARLISEGRTEQVQKLDAETAQRLRINREDSIARLNADLGAASRRANLATFGAAGPSLGAYCEPR
jgi:hypothetical protein